MMRSALVMSLSLPWFIACGSSGSGRKDPAVPPPVKPPVAVLPSQDPETPPASSPGGGTSPAAPGLPVSSPVSPPLTPPAPGSVEAAFVQSASGRWRAYCERNVENNTSRFYAVEFQSDRWSTLMFEFPGNSACIGIASPNDGRPRTYPYSIKPEADGWFRLGGTCLSTDNGCEGASEVLVKILVNEQGNKSVQVKKVQGQGLWFRPGLEEDNYFW
jgi:hypothetical protein